MGERSSAPEAFQGIGAYLVEDLEKTGGFMDDFCAWGSDEEEHDEGLLALLRRLDDHSIRLNVRRCEFGRASMTLLGHGLTQEGVQPDEGGMGSLRDCGAPETGAALQSFLGLFACVGSRFVPDLSQCTEKLHTLTPRGRAVQVGVGP